MKKACIECGESFSGRADAKFCSDQCRSNHHNRNMAPHNDYVRKVNNVLKKNRRILAALNPEGKARAKVDELRRLGFDFNFYTNVYATRDGREYRFCYDQGYLQTSDEWLTLVVKHAYV